MASDLLDALNGLLVLIEKAPTKQGSYTYDYVNEKLWELDDGGKSGNCEECEENADAGWIGDDETFIDYAGEPIDGPPAHPNCECTLKYRERRVRVAA